MTDRNARRIGNLAWQGKPVEDKDRFLVVTNNYRASGGGSFPGLDGRQSIFRSPDSMQTMIVAWLKGGNNTIPPPGPWHFAPLPADAKILFETSPDAVNGKIPPGFTYLEPGPDGFAKFQMTAV
jgi:2',3'-cyclic-nucleotide 2'-phosphodiesterase/3'-nucleotidase